MAAIAAFLELQTLSFVGLLAAVFGLAIGVHVWLGTPLGVNRVSSPGTVLRNDRVIVSRGDTRLQAGDEVLVLVTAESIDDVRKLLTGM